jgi:hypothetical protein
MKLSDKYLLTLFIVTIKLSFEDIHLLGMTLCSPVEVHGRFRGTYYLRLQSLRGSQAKAASKDPKC